MKNKYLQRRYLSCSEVSEKPLQTISETSDYTDLIRLHRFSHRKFNLCNRIFNLCNHKIGISNGASIMVICIWLLISLSFLAVSVGRLTFSQVNFARFYLDREFSYYLAKAIVREASIERDNDLTPNYDTLYELRTRRPVDFGGFRGEYYLIDEESKVNINTADKGILAELLDSEFLAQDVIDYRREERFFVAIEELLNAGVDKELFNEIEDSITVNSNSSININTAPEQVLYALGCSRRALEGILDYRNNNIFDSHATISSVFSDLGIECDYGSLLRTKSSDYTIKTTTYVGQREGVPLDIIYYSAGKRIESWRVTIE